MPQKSRPAVDISVGGWTPVPLYPQLNEDSPNDASKIASVNNPAGNTFEVKLARLAWPQSGNQTLTVRCRKTSADVVPVGMALIQGLTRVIAASRVTPTQSFDNYSLTVTDAQKALITDYTDLRLRVIAGNIVNACCPGGMSPILTAVFTSVSGGCGCLNNLSVKLAHNGLSAWEGNHSTCNQSYNFLNIVCNGPLFLLTMGGCAGVKTSTALNCSPLSISFNNVTVTGCCAGTVNLTVTD